MPHEDALYWNALREHDLHLMELVGDMVRARLRAERGFGITFQKCASCDAESYLNGLCVDHNMEALKAQVKKIVSDLENPNL